MQIKQDFIPIGSKNRPRNSMSPKYITVHNTANTQKDANAEMHARYVKNPTTKESWHFTVDDGDVIYQHLPTNESGFHAGDGAGMGNRQSIGIEICEYAGINQEKANDNAVWLIKKLMKEFNILLANIVPHQKWSGKECPHKLLPIWDSFIKKIGEEGGSATMPTLKIGDQGTLVSQLQTDLNKLGYGLVVDGSFGPAVESAVRAFQTKYKLMVDGIYGSATVNALTAAISAKKDGWVKAGTNWFYYTNGTVKTGWLQDKEKWYYLDVKGIMQIGWVQVASKWYFLNDSGVMQTGWLRDKNKWHYHADSGAMYASTCLMINSKWYCFDKSGAMIEGNVAVDKNGALML